jgi:hypothetical protein
MGGDERKTRRIENGRWLKGNGKDRKWGDQRETGRIENWRWLKGNGKNRKWEVTRGKREE